MTSDIAGDVIAGKVAAGARLIRWLDDGDPRGRAALRLIFPHTGRAHLVGVTGAGGVGKSTLVDAVISEERSRGRRVGVIAVDPSSPFHGGAFLGDRVRMNRHALDDGVFVRSMGTRGQPGGLSRSTHDACLVLDAMGYDVVIVETVGVGQDEIEVVSLAHSTVIVSVPGLGDEVQAIKAGLLEAGEIFVINKADHEGAEQTRRALELMLHLRARSRLSDQWTPPLLSAVATRGEGIAAIVDALDAHAVHLRATGRFGEQYCILNHHQFLSLVRDAATVRVLAQAMRHEATAAIIEAVRTRRMDPYSAAETLVCQSGLILEPSR